MICWVRRSLLIFIYDIFQTLLTCAFLRCLRVRTYSIYFRTPTSAGGGGVCFSLRLTMQLILQICSLPSKNFKRIRRSHWTCHRAQFAFTFRHFSLSTLRCISVLVYPRSECVRLQTNTHTHSPRKLAPGQFGVRPGENGCEMFLFSAIKMCRLTATTCRMPRMRRMKGKSFVTGPTVCNIIRPCCISARISLATNLLWEFSKKKSVDDERTRASALLRARVQARSLARTMMIRVKRHSV